MDLPLIAQGVLWFVTGFAAAVWILAAWTARRHLWRCLAYTLLMVATLLGAAILTALLIQRPFDIPRGVTSLILIPIIAIPAALWLAEWRRSRAVITAQAARIVQEHSEPRRRRSTD